MRKGRKTKTTLIIILLIAIVMMSTAFSAFYQRLEINGIVDFNINPDNWNIAFEKVTTFKTSGYATGSRTVSDTEKSLSFTCELIALGDYCELSANIVNKGTILALFKNHNYVVTAGNQELYNGKEDFSDNILDVVFTLPENWQANTTILNPGDSGQIKVKAMINENAALTENKTYRITINYDFEQVSNNKD